MRELWHIMDLHTFCCTNNRRNTARAENLIRTAVADAHRKFEEMYRG